MLALIQRVSEASVEVDDVCIGAIGAGLLAFIAIQPQDGERQAQRMLERLLGYRIFADAGGRMNRSLRDGGGGLLLVSQFTLAADTRSGMRPSFASAAPPAHGRQVFERLLALAAEAWPKLASGRYGADMQVRLCNDGPVTFLLEAP